jgi:hypothetical protein
MNPRTDLWQAVASAATLALIIAFADPTVAICLAGAGTVVALALNAAYAHALGRRGRSVRRVLGDHLVAAHLALGLALPLLGAVAAAFLGGHPATALWGFRHAEVEALLSAAGALFLVIFLSSLIDWYYIRARIDGVVCAPPCRASKDEKGPWKRVTRRWYIHRGLATLAYILFALFVAVIVMIMLVREDPAAAGVIGGVSGLAGLLLIFAGPYRSELPSVAKWALSPAFVVGDDVQFEGIRKAKRGYVLHVAVPVVKLVPLDHSGRPTDGPFIEPKNSQLAEAELEAKPTRACERGCAQLNPECLRRPGRDNRRVDRRLRRLIL